ncbi:hypothetical protein [Aquimarina pacifica]|uniref:hypothetical protein n=1 Tax=Aquimarina pacifica TaxID=1296415 RepID=UPI00046FB2E4|nr:hypothetical protein [Aquimarina pacifica]
MKHSSILIVLILTLFSCKKETKNEEAQLIRGEFILTDEAAVIKGTDFIYGVVINDLTKELAKKVAPLQREKYDMVPVVVNGIITPNTEEGWEEIVEIKEIIGVSAPTSELPTKIKSSDQSTTGDNHAHDDEGHEGHNH